MDRKLDTEMAEIERLIEGAAKALESIPYCWLATSSSSGVMTTCPMGRLSRKFDSDKWMFRFITYRNSHKASVIRENQRTTLLFQGADDEYLALSGFALIFEDLDQIHGKSESLYDEFFSTNSPYNKFFPTEEDKANAALILITITSINLWIRGLTPEPFGMHATKLVRDKSGIWWRKEESHRR